MYKLGFFELFMEIYNACAASVIIFLTGHIVLMMHRVDRDLLKAKLFLNDVVLQWTWIYISISGAAFALHTVIQFVIMFTTKGDILKEYYLVELTQVIFVISFIYAVHNWYVFIKSFAARK
ncbi:MAG: hypothetical protein WAW23_02755 [Candidatus Methanoperedens sp.]